MSDQIHVAVAVIRNLANQLFITLRPNRVHQGGLWEFPGGKVEAGESVYDALLREVHEENGIDIQRAQPLIKIPFRYPDKHVLLDVWEVLEFNGTAHGKEGQEFRWVDSNELDQYSFPAANKAIINAVRLPAVYLITPEPDANIEKFVAQLAARLSAGIGLVQLRAKQLSEDAFIKLAKIALELCHQCHSKLIINGTPDFLTAIPADGIHLTSERLMKLDKRPLAGDVLVSASCHNLAEIEQANRIGADFIVLAPVSTTPSHPGVQTLGWATFAELTEHAMMPVYALGGMTELDIATSRQKGGQGIAGISSLWAAR
jgi:8-oxo-dGTP diphosphatase